jgi:hypothetical protein
MTIYNISIYSWPTSILKSIEAWIRNFIWSGSIDERKLVTVAWKKICAPFEEGGLGLRSLKVLNAATNLKLCWDLMHSDEDWAKILRSRVLRNGKAINYHVYSSIWSSVKHEVQVISDNSCWKVGNGQSINLWTYSWCGEPLASSQNIHPNVLFWLPSKVTLFRTKLGISLITLIFYFLRLRILCIMLPFLLISLLIFLVGKAQPMVLFL